jgi:hypothetical protein
MPMTAMALPFTPGKRMSRRVRGGVRAARASTIFWRTTCLTSLSTSDNINHYCLSWKDNYFDSIPTGGVFRFPARPRGQQAWNCCFEMNFRLRQPTIAGGNITLTWTGTGTLQQATALSGHPSDWSNVTPPPSGNDYTIRVGCGALFFRLAQ